MKKIQKEYLRRAKLVAYWLQLAPFVRAVILNGSLSRGEAKKTSDIDFLVISKKGRIWSCRMFVTFITQLTGYRRYGDNIAGRICLNRYQTDNYMEIFPHDQYHARTFSQVLLLLNVDETFAKYIKVNGWMKKQRYVIENQKQTVGHSGALSIIREITERILQGRVGNLLEKKFKTYQRKRILGDTRTHQAPKGRVRVSDKELCFHPLK